jgi:hypothetical protein
MRNLSLLAFSLASPVVTITPYELDAVALGINLTLLDQVVLR